MSEKPPSKDEAFEALDFIVNVLKEHEKDLDRLVSELGTVAGQLGDSGELNGKVKKIEDKINSLQAEVGNLVKTLSNSPQKQPTVAVASAAADGTGKVNAPAASIQNGLPMILQVKQREDFLTIAAQAEKVVFAHKESDKNFEAQALKSSQLICFTGEAPDFATLMKTYLSTKLGVSETQILEGNITLK
jgi:flagellar capping protein FliD